MSIYGSQIDKERKAKAKVIWAKIRQLEKGTFECMEEGCRHIWQSDKQEWYCPICKPKDISNNYYYQELDEKIKMRNYYNRHKKDEE